MNTTLAVQEAQQLVVTLLTFQQTPQATVRYVGRLRDTRKELWIPFIHLPIHMEKLIGSYTPDTSYIAITRWSIC